jgi:hypothetical protein
MVDSLDREWWAKYRGDVANRLRQETLVVRATAVDLL